MPSPPVQQLTQLLLMLFLHWMIHMDMLNFSSPQLYKEEAWNVVISQETVGLADCGAQLYADYLHLVEEVVTKERC